MLNFADLIIILFVIAAAVRGYKYGFLQQGFSLIGFWAGIILTALIILPLSKQFDEGVSAGGIIFLIILGALAGLWVGEAVGHKLAVLFKRIKLGWLNKAGGVVLNSSLTLLLIWLSANLLNAAPVYELNRQLAGSQIIRAIDNKLQSPPSLLAEVQQLLRLGDFPQVFIGLEPSQTEPVIPPGSESVRAVTTRLQPSVVQIEGNGCGGIKNGSGFVAASDLIITNAHVVAGLSSVFVNDTAGRKRATLVHFDPNLDIAVLRVQGLSGPPLALNTDVAARGQTGAVLGYPNGGNYTGVASAVLARFTASGRDIYGGGRVNRTVYSIQTTVVPGNSGGPFVNLDGQVLGVIFASSTTNNGVGYAITAQEADNSLKKASSQVASVSSGNCD